MREGVGVGEEGVDLYTDLAVREEGSQPFTEGWGKAKEGEEVTEPFDVNVVEEPLYVKQKKGAH